MAAPAAAEPDPGHAVGEGGAHRGPFGTQLARDVPSLVLTLLVGAASSAAGVGGGAFFVPLFDIVVGVGVRAATSLSQVCVAAGALTACAARAAARHPLHPDRHLIDADLALLALPPLLLGVSAGLLANHAFPTWLLTFLLIALLTFVTADTALRARRLHAREREAAAAAAAAVQVVAISAAASPRAAGLRRASGVDADTMSTFSIEGEGLAPALSLAAGLRGRGGGRDDEGGVLSPGSVWRRMQPAPLRRHSVGDLETGAPDRARRRFATFSAGGAAAAGALAAAAAQVPPRGRSGVGRTLSATLHEGDEGAGPDGGHPSSSPFHARAASPPPPPGSSVAGDGDEAEDGMSLPSTMPSAALDGGGGSGKADGGASGASSRAPRTLAARLASAAPGIALATIFAVMLGLQIARSLAPRCSRAWIAAAAAQAAFAAAATAASGAYLVRKHAAPPGAGCAGGASPCCGGGGARPARAKDAAAHPSSPPPAALAPYGTGTVDFSPRTVAVGVACSLVGGVFASLLGIGGGILLVPLFLALGAHPAAAAATSTLMILFSSTSAAAGQAAAGYVPPSFALAFGVASLAAGALGAWGVASLIARTGRASLLVWLLTAIIGGGAALTLGYGGYEAVRELIKGGPAAQFKSVCAP